MGNFLLDANYKLSRNVRISVLIAALILLVLNLSMVDYTVLFSRENLGAGLNILANLFIIAGMTLSLRHTRNNS